MDNKLPEISAKQIASQKLAITSLVRDWFWSITEQKSASTLLAMLGTEFELIFPDSTLCSADDFSRWYAEVKNMFFNQQHLIRSLDIELNGEIAYIALWVNWQAEQRNSSQAHSQKLDFDAMQLWQVEYQQGKWLITNYNVVDLKNNVTDNVNEEAKK